MSLSSSFSRPYAASYGRHTVCEADGEMNRVFSALLFGILARAQGTSRAGDYINQGLAIPSNNSASAPADDACFSSWNVYWAANSSISTVGDSFVPTATITETLTTLDSAGSAYTSTKIGTITDTSYVINGPFTLSTQIRTSTYSVVDTQTAYPASNRTWTRTKTEGITSTPSNSIATPTCTLPTLVSQCQNQWEQFVTAQLIPTPSPPSHCNLTEGAYQTFTNPDAAPACVKTFGSQMVAWRSSVSATKLPGCSQASIGGQLCQSVRDSYQQGRNMYFQPDFIGAGPGFHFNGGSLGLFNGFSTSWTWPTSSTLQVPSCTLGCGRCAITGGTVQLLWWPPATSTDSSSGAIQTVVTDGTTLTSPTLYISYSKMHAQNGCGDVGSTITSTIIPIPTNQALSSVWGFGLACDAHQRNEQDQYRLYTASFNVTDMVEPVPQSIYTSMPRCATEMHCGGTCKMDDAYKPILVVPHDVLRDIQPAWADCFGDLNGVYDPPVALQRVSTIAGPTAPGGYLPGPTAEPGGSVQPSGPQATYNPAVPSPEPEKPGGPPNNDGLPNSDPQSDKPVGNAPTSYPSANVPSGNGPATRKSPSNGPSPTKTPDNAQTSDRPYVYQPNTPTPGQGQPNLQDASPVPNPGPSNNVPNAPVAGPAPVSEQVIIPIGTTIVPINSRTQIVISSSTITPGGQAVVISSTTYSLAPSASALIANGHTLSRIPPAVSGTPTAVTFASAEVTVLPASGGQVVIGPSTTVTVPSNASGVTIGSVPISLDSSGQRVVGSSTALPEDKSPTTTSTMTSASEGPSGTTSSISEQQSGNTAGQTAISFSFAAVISLLCVLTII